MPITRIDGTGIDGNTAPIGGLTVNNDIILNRTGGFDNSIVVGTASNSENRNVIFQRVGGGPINGAWQFRGTVLMPEKPAFYVWSDIYTPQRTYASEVIFNTANSNGINLTTNIGGHFVASTGRFTAPIGGTYSFVGAFSRSGGNATIDIFRNGGSVGVRHLSYGADWQTATASAILTLAAGDFVQLAFGGTNGTTTSGYRIHFMGEQIG